MAQPSIRYRPNARPRAFTLIELLVVTAIIVVVTAVALVSNSRFGGVVQLENLTYNIALSIRQAQVYGISVARFGESTFSAGYGVHFDVTNPASATAYAIFADALTPNGMYDCPNPGTNNCELVETTEITGGYRIQGLCAPAGTDAATCTPVQKLDILFVRPEPDAWISASEISCILPGGTCQTSARISLISPRGNTMSVVVETNGQISVRRQNQ